MSFLPRPFTDEPMSERILVVGGNAAGMTAASRAKRLDPSLSVTVFESGRRIAYSICGLPYCLSGRVAELEDLVLFTPESLMNERGIEARVGMRAVAISAGKRQLVVEDTRSGSRSSFPYDKLLISTGYRPLRPALDGIELEGVFTASRLDDGEAILKWLQEHDPRRAVLIGGGYVGLEMAEALRKRGLAVTLVETQPHVFSSLDRDMAALVEKELGEKGVDVMTGRKVARLHGGASGHARRVGSVELTPGGLRLPADLVFVDVGVSPNVSLAADAGIQIGTSGAIAVSEQMETSQAAVYAAGNCVETTHLVSGRAVLMPLGTVAVKQGRIAGENLAGRRSTFRGAVGTSSLKVFDVVASRTGLTTAEAEGCGFSVVSATIEGKFQASYFDGGANAHVKVLAERRSGRLLGAQIVGAARAALRIDIMATALTARLTVSESSQLDLAYTPAVGSLWNPVLIALNKLGAEV